MSNGENYFINVARDLAAAEYNRYHISQDETRTVDETLTSHDMYVVWFSKTLKNWKALVSTDKLRGAYFEVTQNGEDQEVYVDYYQKVSNQTYKLSSHD